MLNSRFRWFTAIVLILGSYFNLAKSALAISPPPGTLIDNTATASFEGNTSGITRTATSNTVTLQVVEVAGITVQYTGNTEAPSNVTNAGVYQGIAGINTGDVVYFDFTLTNVGNDPTRFFIPNNAVITGGNLQGNIQIIAVDPDGTGATPEKSLAPVSVVTGDNTINLLGSPDGYIPVGGIVKVRIPVKVTETTVGNPISVVLGNTSPTNSQNVNYVNSGNDVYTVDFANGTVVPTATGYTGTTAEATGTPVGGEKEASATGTVNLAEIPVIQGFKSVKLTNDADSSGSVSSNDELTWTVVYKNTSNVAIPNFQMSDLLDTDTTRTGASAITVSVTINGVNQTAPTLNASYTGLSGNTNLLQTNYTLPANGVITVNIPVKVVNGTVNNTLISNQTTATGDNLLSSGILTDNIDNTTTLPQYVTIPSGSITQEQFGSIDPTITITGTPTLQGYKSVKLTTDTGTEGLTPGDSVTWTVIYKNTGTVDIPNFQITDTLPTGVQRNVSPITITTNGSGQSTPTANPSYNGTGNNNLLQNSVTLKAGATVIINIPVDIKTGTAGTTQNNQTTATGSNITTPISSDNVDSDTGLSEVPTGSIKQTQTATIDPTSITIPTTPSPIISGYKSVKWTSDVDNTTTITPGDTLAWTITYINTETVNATGFQINDTLPAGLTKSGTITISTNSTQGTTPNPNSSYTGTTGNTSLLETPITLKAGGIITITIPVTIDTGTTGTKQNQATASGTNITNTDTDNTDSNPVSPLPTGVIVPVGSIDQTEQVTIDPTTVTIVSPPSATVSGYKSVKQTTDTDNSNSVTPGDIVTWTIVYKNTGTVTTSNFQITDSLPSGVTKSGTPTVTVTGSGQTTPTVDTNYNGTTNTNLFSTSVPLVAGGVIAVKIPVMINMNQVGNKTNQATGNGTNTDNVDDLSSSLPADVLAQIETGSINQDEQGTVDATLITIPEVKGFKSVKLTTDTDGNNVVTQNDVITWTIVYKNTGNKDIPNFQITDSLPVGVNYTSGMTITPNVTQGGTITPNGSYNGTGNLLQSPITLKAGGVITINLPVTITTSNDTTLSNQATATGDILPSVGVNTDNVDSNTAGLPSEVTIPSDSIAQNEQGSIDPTTVLTGSFPIQGFKSVKLTNDIGNDGLTINDTVTWSIFYTNTGTVDLTNFQISDVLPSGVTLSGSLSNSNITVTGTGQIAPSANTNYNGTGNNNLFSTGVTLKAGGTIQVNIPVTIDTTTPLIKNNQSSGTGTGITTPILTDNVDSDSTGLPNSITIPANSIKQFQTNNIDPTSIKIDNSPQVVAYKSVKLTTDVNNNSVINPSDIVTWQITYVNTGTVDITNFDITDILPSGLTFLSSTITINTAQNSNPISTNSAYNGTGSLLTNLFTLKAGGMITITLQTQIDTGVTGTKQNQATGTNGSTVTIVTDNIDNTTSSIPSGVIVPTGSISQTQIASIDPTSINIIPTESPQFLLIKRITAIKPVDDPSYTQFNEFVDLTTGLQAGDDNDLNWPDSDGIANNATNDYLRGVLDGGVLKPGSLVEYTIYYVNKGNNSVTNVTLCDLVPSDMTFVNDSFGSGQGIGLWDSSSPVSPSKVTLLTNAGDSDGGTYYPPGTTPPSACKQYDATSGSFVPMTASTNVTGLVVVNLGTVPHVISSGNPNNPVDSYGFFRFRAKINEP